MPPAAARTRRTFALLVALVVAGAVAGVAPSIAMPFPGAAGCPTFPANSFWHADVSRLPVHAQSSTWVASVGPTAKLKADFGSGTWDGGPIGIPFTTVAGTQARVPVSFDYADESDPGPYPVPPTAPIEGGPASTGDRHVLVVDRDACRLWELYDAHPQNGGSSWTAGSGATWDLRSNTMRPLGWTSGDAAGLPILPGLVRRDEVAAGEIDHVIRFTAPRTANAFVWPASHKAATGGASDPPMGSWFRLKAGFDISGYSAQNQVILRALKKHGMVLADNGSSWFLSGAPDPGWNDSDLHLLRNVAGSAFEAVDVSSLKVSATSYQSAGSTLPTTTTPGPTTTTPADHDHDPADHDHDHDPADHDDDQADHDHDPADRHVHHRRPGPQPRPQPRVRVQPGELEHGHQPNDSDPNLRGGPHRVVLGADRPHDLRRRGGARRLPEHGLLLARRRHVQGLGVGQGPGGKADHAAYPGVPRIDRGPVPDGCRQRHRRMATAHGDRPARRRRLVGQPRRPRLPEHDRHGPGRRRQPETGLTEPHNGGTRRVLSLRWTAAGGS